MTGRALRVFTMAMVSGVARVQGMSGAAASIADGQGGDALGAFRDLISTRTTRHAAVAPMTLPVLANGRARRLFLDRHLLLRPGAGPGKGADLDQVLHSLGFVQVDSVNTLARAHDLILWSRRGQYRPKALEQLVGRHRTGFEAWTHDASVIPMAFYPMWRLKFARDEARIRARWSPEKVTKWAANLDAVLRHVSDHGVTSSRDVGEETPSNKTSQGWWDWHPSMAALEFLWRSGRLAICHRKGFRKHYNLAERVIPPEQRNARRDDAEIVDWAMAEAMRRLGFGTAGELADFFAIVTREEAKAWCAEALAAGRILEIEIETADGERRLTYATEEALDSAADLPDPSTRVRLLSPFDPALRDRARAEWLFGFRYRIEIFVPAAKRQYGYYVFPVLQGDRLIGRIDAKREGDVLAVRAFWAERGVRMGKGRVAGLQSELERLFSLTATKDVRFDTDFWRGASPRPSERQN